jgi:hypothetical protein
VQILQMQEIALLRPVASEGILHRAFIAGLILRSAQREAGWTWEMEMRPWVETF